MKFFAIESNFNIVDKSAFEKAIDGHIAFLENGYIGGFILAAGPKPAMDGGFCLMKAESLEAVQKYLCEDPLNIAGISQYKIVEFMLHKCLPIVSDWFSQ